jgi:hypothetical protein
MKESKISLKHQSLRLSGHFYITLPAILLGKPITFFFTENGTDPGNYDENAILLCGGREHGTLMF